MSVIDGFDLNNFNFMNWDYLAIYEVNRRRSYYCILFDLFSGYFPTREQRHRADPELLADCDQLNRISFSYSLLCGKKRSLYIIIVQFMC